MKKLALIPARGGSKRLPGKNRRLLGGKPLVAYPIEAATRSGCFDKIVVSTDSDQIAEIANKYSGVVVDERPEELATDTATIRDVALELMQRYETNSEPYDVIAIMLPTAPFVASKDIRRGMKFLSDNEDVNSVISVMEYDFPPQKGSIIDPNGLLHPVWPNSPFYTGNTRTQDQFPVYHENGCFFICRWKNLIRDKSYYIGKVKAYTMPKKGYVDIDTEIDFMYAQFLIEKGIYKPDQ